MFPTPFSTDAVSNFHFFSNRNASGGVGSPVRTLCWVKLSAGVTYSFSSCATSQYASKVEVAVPELSIRYLAAVYPGGAPHDVKASGGIIAGETPGGASHPHGKAGGPSPGSYRPGRGGETPPHGTGSFERGDRKGSGGFGEAREMVDLTEVGSLCVGSNREDPASPGPPSSPPLFCSQPRCCNRCYRR